MRLFCVGGDDRGLDVDKLLRDLFSLWAFLVTILLSSPLLVTFQAEKPYSVYAWNFFFSRVWMLHAIFVVLY